MQKAIIDFDTYSLLLDMHLKYGKVHNDISRDLQYMQVYDFIYGLCFIKHIASSIGQRQRKLHFFVIGLSHMNLKGKINIKLCFQFNKKKN